MEVQEVAVKADQQTLALQEQQILAVVEVVENILLLVS
jgi:hypothetical protein